MGKKKRGLWLATGIVAGVLLASAARKIKEDFEENVLDNLDDDREVKEKAKDWFADKKEHFQVLVEEKQAQINKITAKLKKDVIKEIDEEKRKELVKKATEKIAQLKEEIKEITNEKREVFLDYMKDLSGSDIIKKANEIGTKAKNFAKEKLAKKDEELEIILDEEEE